MGVSRVSYGRGRDPIELCAWSCGSPHGMLLAGGAGMARDCTESRFREVLERYGGAQQVLLVGELWERAESRALLENFLRELFPAELLSGGDLFKNKAPPPHGATEPDRPCKGENPASDRPTNRTIRFGLVFFLCRPQSLTLPASQRQLREILRDIRKRLPAGGAVVGVVMLPADKVNGEESPVCAVSALLSLLRSVFPENSKGGRCSEVRAAALLPGHEESRRDVQRAACEALTAADEQRRNKPNVKSRCFAWRRWRQEDTVQKEHLEEGTALTVLNYPNGDCSENTADA
ncbi:hypothetical protein GDO81_007765 [Engystomops pustulosus]|uniref:C2orf72-like C-terminal domain-containing protein n=1 Tax=Engystomops pustulosus TaxID=76066 RepID=A0AAV7CAR1_ENGPU|nr:hypothetical protein GDO81_007765 [Engystomops pustulosus]